MYSFVISWLLKCLRVAKRPDMQTQSDRSGLRSAIEALGTKPTYKLEDGDSDPFGMSTAVYA